MPELYIPISQPSAAFEQHLKLEGNDRILFSGIFGIGKTTFLRHFFEERGADYLTIRLCPINYSVASNEDIFQFIRYDLFLQIVQQMENPPDTSNPYYNNWANTIGFFVDQADEILEAAAKFIPEIGGALSHLIKKVYEWNEGFLKSRARDSQSEEANEMTDFLDRTGASYFYGNDPVDKIIHLYLEYAAFEGLKEGGKPRETVLIIDDLDRLDPGHTFRLFNIFSAHFDYGDQSGNKFGFDKLVFVCDLNNIRSTFKAQYGQETDFSGYIDKFYKRQVFYFNNDEGITEMVQETINSILLAVESNVSSPVPLPPKDLLVPILIQMIYANAINLRQFLRLRDQSESLTDRQLTFPGSLTGPFFSRHFDGILLIDLLVKMLGDVDNLLYALEKTAYFQGAPNQSSHRRSNFSGAYKRVASLLLPILGYQDHSFEEAPNTNYSFDLQMDRSVRSDKKLLEVTYLYQLRGEISEDRYTAHIRTLRVKVGSGEPEDQPFHSVKEVYPFLLLLSTVRSLKEMGNL